MSTEKVLSDGRAGREGTFPLPLRLRSMEFMQRSAHTMDDLRYDPSALLIVGMLIGLVCTLFGA